MMQIFPKRDVSGTFYDICICNSGWINIFYSGYLLKDKGMVIISFLFIKGHKIAIWNCLKVLLLLYISRNYRFLSKLTKFTYLFLPVWYIKCCKRLRIWQKGKIFYFSNDRLMCFSCVCVFLQNAAPIVWGTFYCEILNA